MAGSAGVVWRGLPALLCFHPLCFQALWHAQGCHSSTSIVILSLELNSDLQLGWPGRKKMICRVCDQKFLFLQKLRSFLHRSKKHLMKDWVGLKKSPQLHIANHRGLPVLKNLSSFIVPYESLEAQTCVFPRSGDIDLKAHWQVNRDAPQRRLAIIGITIHL